MREVKARGDLKIKVGKGSAFAYETEPSLPSAHQACLIVGARGLHCSAPSLEFRWNSSHYWNSRLEGEFQPGTTIPAWKSRQEFQPTLVLARHGPVVPGQCPGCPHVTTGTPGRLRSMYTGLVGATCNRFTSALTVTLGGYMSKWPKRSTPRPGGVEVTCTVFRGGFVAFVREKKYVASPKLGNRARFRAVTPRLRAFRLRLQT